MNFALFSRPCGYLKWMQIEEHMHADTGRKCMLRQQQRRMWNGIHMQAEHVLRAASAHGQHTCKAAKNIEKAKKPVTRKQRAADLNSDPAANWKLCCSMCRQHRVQHARFVVKKPEQDGNDSSRRGTSEIEAKAVAPTTTAARA